MQDFIVFSPCVEELRVNINASVKIQDWDQVGVGEIGVSCQRSFSRLPSHPEQTAADRLRNFLFSR